MGASEVTSQAKSVLRIDNSGRSAIVYKIYMGVFLDYVLCLLLYIIYITQKLVLGHI